MIVLLHPIPRKYLEGLNEPDKGYIIAALAGLEQELPKGDIKPLAGEPRRYRLRINKYRAFFRYEDNHIWVTHIESRGQAYKKKNKGDKR